MTIRVMLVDDHRIVREGLAYMLGGAEDVVIAGEADSGAQLLATFDDVTPDVVLLDIHMPEMSGLEALEELHVRHPDAKVIMLSMQDQASYVQQALRCGALGYMLKSVGLDELLRAIEMVATGRVYLQGELAVAAVSQEAAESVALSPRELEVLGLMSAGLQNKQIARRLGISEATVKTHVKALYARLGVRGRAEATAMAMRLGLIK
jgi:DNA-binding NarL/FixJ family response regulator